VAQEAGRPEPARPDSARRRPDWEQLIRTLQRTLRSGPAPAVSELATERRDPFAVLVSTIISSRTKDEVTAQASTRLLRRAPSARQLARLSPAQIARLIYPAGFYRVKAEHLRKAAVILLQRHQGRVPSGMTELLALPGVGRKTANLVRNLGFGLQGICVDTHVHRVSNRLGWVHTTTPEQTEAALQKVLPRRYWIPINALLVAFGQSVCTPVSPRCSVCPLASRCPRIGVARSR
jgi:endonuclease-3